MDALTRRKFLISSGVVGGAAVLAGAGAVSWAELHHAAKTRPLASNESILVLVTLYGGNDGLNTVVPYADPAYHDARPDLSYTAEQVHRLSDTVGLNPSLTGLAGLYGDGHVAIVQGVSYPKPDYSHFRAMDIWQTASPSTPVNTGWVGRWLDSSGDDPVRALNIGTVLPPLAVGARCTAAALNPGGRELSPRLAAVATGLGRSDSTDSVDEAVVATSFRNERTVARIFAPVLDAASQANGSQAGGQTGQSSGELGQQLSEVAACVKAGVPTRVYLVSLGGFDTHADEKGTQEALLSSFDSAVSSFLKEMAQDENGRKVVLMAYSEFGRRVAANASEGTDHGSAGPVFVAGAPVKGGIHGELPSLTDLDDGNLKFTVDFRALYGEMLHKVLGADPHRVLDSVPAELGVLV